MSWHDGAEGGEAEVVAGGRPWKVDGDVGAVVKGRSQAWIVDQGDECSVFLKTCT